MVIPAMMNRARALPSGQAWLGPIERLVVLAAREVRLLAPPDPAALEADLTDLTGPIPTVVIVAPLA